MGSKVKDKDQISPMVQTQEIHCPGCGRFIGFHAIVWGMIKLKCPNCKQWTTIDINPDHVIQ